MTYRIQGLAPEPFRPLFRMNDEELRERRAVRVVASGSGEPCRVSLQDAAAGEQLILVNHVSQDADTPFRATHAIYVREQAEAAPVFEDELPPQIDRRNVSLRAFDRDGMMVQAVLAAAGEGDGAVRALLERPEVAEIHAHTQALGCFLARIERN
jgi:hypothetical protein